MKTNIDNIPKQVLSKILCRLPSKYVFQCRCVSKSWYTLLSNPKFIGRYLCFHSEKQTPIARTFVNTLGTTDEFPRFRRLLHSNSEFRIVGSCNDLVLYSSNNYGHWDYHICNPRTMKVLTLPKAPLLMTQVFSVRRIFGFICEPFYEENNVDRDGSDDDDQTKTYKIKAEYKCKVLGILPPENWCFSLTCYKFNMLMFSTETGKWESSLVPCPQGYRSLEQFWSSEGFACNGMLYWIGRDLLVLDLHRHQFHIIEISQNPVTCPFDDEHSGCVGLSYDNKKLGSEIRSVGDVKEHVVEKIVANGDGILHFKRLNDSLLPVVLPWWPSPLPRRLAQNGRGIAKKMVASKVDYRN